MERYEIKVVSERSRAELATHPRLAETWGDMVAADVAQLPVNVWVDMGAHIGATLADLANEVSGVEYREI